MTRHELKRNKRRVYLAISASLAVTVAAPAPASAAAPAPGFQINLASPGRAHLECFVSRRKMQCLNYSAAEAPGRCEYGGDVPTAQLARRGRATETYTCVDEGFHGWKRLRAGQTFRSGAFRCRADKRRATLRCMSTVSRWSFTFNSAGKLTLAPPPVSKPRDCNRLTFIGVAGSGQNGSGQRFKPSYGAPVGAFRKKFLRQLPSRIRNDTRSVPLDYPATQVNDWSGRANYLRSEGAGVVELGYQLATDRCSSKTRYVLAGYSQGAHVVSDVLASLGRKLRKRIAAVVLFADPVFDPLDNDVTQLGSWSPSWAGALVSARLDKIKGAGSQFPVYTYCREGDAACQGSSRNYTLRTWVFRADRVTSSRALTIHSHYNMYIASASKLTGKAVRQRVSAK